MRPVNKKKAKKPNPVARSLKEHKPRVVPDKTRYRRKKKHPKEEKNGPS